MGHRQTTPGTDIPSAHCQTATQSVAKQSFSAMEIERDNKDKCQDWVLRGFRQFDAPVCVIITYDVCRRQLRYSSVSINRLNLYLLALEFP
jgi:hypothetical protein